MLNSKWMPLAVLAMALASPGWAQTIEEIVANVTARDEGVTQVRDAEVTLTDKRGKTREQTIRVYRKYYGEEKRTIIFYVEPANVRDTGFLTIDYPGVEKDDDQWLYLPALRKVRRISASNKGDYFLGTDLTYDDLKRDAKVNPHDFTWTLQGATTVNGIECQVIEGTPVSESVAEELGYSKGVIAVDPSNWMVVQLDYWDVNGNHLKTIDNNKIAEIEGIWTTNQIHVVNHKSEHQTTLDFTSTSYEQPVEDDIFSEMALKRGAPR